MNSAVENAIEHIWERYGEPLSLSDIARSAILSRFHFSRVFREATGVSPGRFLSAVRIYQAKRLLVSTSLSVTEISLAVGYNSLGSFTNRFTESVGAPPSQFRRMRGYDTEQAAVPSSCSTLRGSVAGRVCLPSDYAAARIYIGAFETPIIQRRPLSWAIVEAEPSSRAAAYRLADVQAGDWFIKAVAVGDSTDPEPWTCRSLLVGGYGPESVTAGAESRVDIALRPRRPTDLPILFAVPDLGSQELGLAAVGGSSRSADRHARPGRATEAGRDAA
jgi:AraC family transcriptional regulator